VDVISALAQELDRADGDAVQAFSAYERRLGAFMARQQRAAARFASSFTPKTAFGMRVRDGVLNLMNVPGVGPLLARSMLGNTFPLPVE
jgi:2-polyprenyl-6-methoxyphenol hydroxylase-like FAD-dependent oxidoreductase